MCEEKRPRFFIFKQVMIGLANDFSHPGSALPVTMSTPASIAAELQLFFDTLYLTQVSKYAQGRRGSCLTVFYGILNPLSIRFLFPVV